MNIFCSFHYWWLSAGAEAQVGLVAAAISLIAAILIFLTWQQMRKDARERRVSNEQQVRAYLFLKASNCPPIIEGEKVLIPLEFKNSGQTPAFEVEVWTNSEFLPPRSNPKIPIDVTYDLVGSLGPDNEFQRYEDYLDKWNKNDLIEFNEGKKNLYVWGIIRYKTFGKTRETRFQLYTSNKGIKVKKGDENQKIGLQITRNFGGNDAT